MNDSKNSKRCWIKIGIWGDHSCPELKKNEHCLNCPVYQTAGNALLEKEAPEGYLEEWTNHFHYEPDTSLQHQYHPTLIFRIAYQWLAMPINSVQGITECKPTHRLPHSRNSVLLGITNIKGDLKISISLEALLGIEKVEDDSITKGLSFRLYPGSLIFGKDDDDYVSPVDEVHGLFYYDQLELEITPITISKTLGTFTKGIFQFNKNSIGLLDDELLIQTIKEKYL